MGPEPPGAPGDGGVLASVWEESDLIRAASLMRRIVSARAYGIPAAERADLLQEALLQLWRAAVGPSAGEVRSVEGLAATITHRCCLAWLRRRRPLENLPHDIPDPAPSLEEALIRRERRELAIRVIRALPGRCRDVLRLHVFQRLPYQEIARRLGRSEHGLRTQVYECLKEARGILERLRAPRPRLQT